MIVDKVFEDKVLACLVSITSFASVASRHLKPEYYDHPVKHNVCKMALDFYKKYDTVLSPMGFAHELKRLIEKKFVKEEEKEKYIKYFTTLKKLPVSDHKFILDNLIVFIKKAELKRFIDDSVDKLLPHEKFDEIEKRMARLAQIKTTRGNEPYDYWQGIEKRTERRIEEATVRMLGISTGIGKLDEALYKRGWYKGELYVILGAPKRGKTMSVIWFANVAALLGKNVVYFSNEVSKEIISDRLDALNAATEMKMLTTKTKHVKDKVTALRERAGKLIILDYPTRTLTVNQMKEDLNVLESEGIRIDMVITDYADIMIPNFHTGDTLKDEGSIYEDLRGLAKEFDVPVLTPSQLNRTGSKKLTASGGDTGGTFDKIKIADLVITLNATEEEKAEGEVRIHLSESRNSESKTLRIKTDYHTGRFYKELLEEVY